MEAARCFTTIKYAEVSLIPGDGKSIDFSITDSPPTCFKLFPCEIAIQNKGFSYLNKSALDFSFFLRILLASRCRVSAALYNENIHHNVTVSNTHGTENPLIFDNMQSHHPLLDNRYS